MAEIQAPFVRKFFAQNTHYTEFIPETSSSLDGSPAGWH
jgi:hypothetical protein